MVSEKFNKDFAKGNKHISKIIEDIVSEYFSREKVTEETLRQLKSRVTSAVGDYRKNNPSNSVKGSSVVSKK